MKLKIVVAIVIAALTIGYVVKQQDRPTQSATNEQSDAASHSNDKGGSQITKSITPKKTANAVQSVRRVDSSDGSKHLAVGVQSQHKEPVITDQEVFAEEQSEENKYHVEVWEIPPEVARKIPKDKKDDSDRIPAEEIEKRFNNEPVDDLWAQQMREKIVVYFNEQEPLTWLQKYDLVLQTVTCKMTTCRTIFLTGIDQDGMRRMQKYMVVVSLLENSDLGVSGLYTQNMNPSVPSMEATVVIDRSLSSEFDG